MQAIARQNSPNPVPCLEMITIDLLLPFGSVVMYRSSLYICTYSCVIEYLFIYHTGSRVQCANCKTHLERAFI